MKRKPAITVEDRPTIDVLPYEPEIHSLVGPRYEVLLKKDQTGKDIRYRTEVEKIVYSTCGNFAAAVYYSKAPYRNPNKTAQFLQWPSFLATTKWVKSRDPYLKFIDENEWQGATVAILVIGLDMRKMRIMGWITKDEFYDDTRAHPAKPKVFDVKPTRCIHWRYLNPPETL